MLYPLVSKVVKSKFNGIHKEIHASEFHEIFEKIWFHIYSSEREFLKILGL